jgi:hypothetical protein
MAQGHISLSPDTVASSTMDALKVKSSATRRGLLGDR